MENLFGKQYKNLEAHYRQALYVCPEYDWEIKIGRTYLDIDELLEMEDYMAMCILTADNPGSHIQPDEENRKAYQRMVNQLRLEGYEFVPGLNQDPRQLFPDERSVWVFEMDLSAGEKYGKQFGQNAFVYYRRKETAQLIWCI